jgi:ABC-type transporter Mla subunit MlaD
MRRIALIAATLLLAGAVWLLTSASSPGPRGGGSYQVRAIFDNAAFAVPGEQVRIAGAPVGSISSLAVTSNYEAAVTLNIDSAGFRPFYANATCAIRPQSLIAERYVDCTPGTSSDPPLTQIRKGPGAGSYLLPVTQTSSPVDSDIVQDISQEPIRQRLSIILDELGTGLAARGSDLNAVIHRADPALGYTDQVFKILAHQNKVLAKLATDSDAVLKPLAAARKQIADFVVQANTTAVASAARQADISTSIHLLPSFLTQLKPLMVDLGDLAQQGTPVMSSLSQSATAVDRQFSELIPFASAARTSLIDLGNAAQQSEQPLIQSESLATRLNNLGKSAAPSAALLDKLTASLDSSGALEDLMQVLFYGTGATNGFNADGHYVRSDALVGGCTAYATTPVSVCVANFPKQAAATKAQADATSSGSAASVDAIVRQALGAGDQPSTSSALRGLLHYLIGSGS